MLIPIVIDSDGSSTRTTGSGLGSSGSASVSPIVTSAIPATATDLPRAGLLGVDAIERLGDVELDDLHALDRAVGPAPRHLLAPAERAVAHPAQGKPAHVGRRIEVGDQRLQRHRVVVGRRRDLCEQRVEQRLQVGSRASGASPQCPVRAFAYRIGKSI